ncbi:tripartite tricarboxylate transporter substrate binding protein [Pigmentiphaga sp. GD03639]|uniref:Bug family tripartite tricarboxylate transporter substrate binding protein n=1 Tax=Pigmentiphaga sp. GD03639 TaxID=2975354 RepID=UPI002449960B|nr:tripartite tricarboxylate transporter substrate binding protein [Pigmentiphaga sp. GD03639]MDH2240002.1 tripartite tricarboxylate transporter substrate binding protein [Pigmentiphaga sp. GD03639]
MKKTRQAIACLALLATATALAAQDWPSRATTVINPFSAGTTTDTVARVVAEGLQKKYGTPFIVDSRPGAGGMIGTTLVARAHPDGSTFGVSIAGPLVHNPLLYKRMAYDPAKDLTPLTLGVHQPCLLIASRQLGVKTLPELIDVLKKNPGKYNYSYVGNGSLGHLVMTLLANKSGTQIVPVMYAGAVQATTAVMTNEVQMGCLPAQATMAQVRGDKVVPIAVSTAERAALLPEVPALREFYPDIVGSAWMGFVAPGGMPAALAGRISAAIGEVLRQPQVVELLRQQLMEPAPGTPAQFKAFMQEELARWKPVIVDNKITAE